MQEPKIIENAYVPPVGSMSSGTKDLTINRDGCGHAMTVNVYMHNGRIEANEVKRIKAEIASTPCEQCKEEENAQS